MKKIIFSGIIVLFIVSMALVSYAEMQKIDISEGNLADLKGRWVGSRISKDGLASNTDLEITNDSLQLQGKAIFYDVRIGRRLTQEYYDFTEVKINNKGNLLIRANILELELSLYKDDGKMKLEGSFSSRMADGRVSFTRK